MYSTAEEINRFTERLAAGATPVSAPLFVLDMDGNILIGYNVKAGHALPVPQDAERRDIPEGSDIDALLRQGVIEPALFAAKPMDARLPATLATRLNALEQAGEPFRIAILTSRSEADALTVLRDSGVTNPEWHTLVADSGAVLRVGGERRAIRPLNDDERAFLDRLPALSDELETTVDAELQAQGLSPAGRPPLRLEPKGIASNVHFREILGHYGQTDESSLAQGLTQALETRLQDFIAGRETAFKLLRGPATLEVKLADIHKGHGLEAVANAALRHGTPPSAVIFAGDDVCTRGKDGTPRPGTDYYAFKAAPELSRKSGIPFHTIHTLHPAGGRLDGTEPDRTRLPMPGLPSPDLTVATPFALAEMIENTLKRYRSMAERLRERDGGVSIRR